MWYNCALLPLTSLEASTHARSWRIQKQRLPLRAVASLFPNSSAAFSFPICLSCGCLDFVRSLVFITFEPFEALHFGPICTTSISRCQKKCAFLQELLRCLSLSCTFQSTHRAFCRASKSKRCSDTAKKKNWSNRLAPTSQPALPYRRCFSRPLLLASISSSTLLAAVFAIEKAVKTCNGSSRGKFWGSSISSFLALPSFKCSS